MSFNTRDITPLIATEIRASKELLLGGEYASRIRQLLEQRGVLVFPKISFTDEEQIAFTQTLGTFAPEMRGEKIYKISLDAKVNQQADYLKGSLYWHLDGTMNAVPILASLLSSKVLPPSGGDTEFCNTYAAFDALSDAQKQQFEKLRVMHSAWNTLFYYDPEPSVETLRQMMAIGDRELPLVWTHRSGRKSLVIGASFLGAPVPMYLARLRCRLVTDPSDFGFGRVPRKPPFFMPCCTAAMLEKSCGRTLPHFGSSAARYSHSVFGSLPLGTAHRPPPRRCTCWDRSRRAGRCSTVQLFTAWPIWKFGKICQAVPLLPTCSGRRSARSRRARHRRAARNRASA
jgi:hypothetical protein